MRYRIGALGLLLLCGGCFPKKAPEGDYTTELWNMPVKIQFKGGKTTVNTTYKNAPLTATGDYTFSDKDNGSDFEFHIRDVQIKHGNPFTQQMLSQEVESLCSPKNYRGYLKWSNPGEMDMVFDGGSGQPETHIIFKKAKS